MFVQLGLWPSSDMSMRIYSAASIAENPLLAVRCSFVVIYILQNIAWLAV